MTSSMLNFYVILQLLATTSVLKCVETLDFYIWYIFWQHLPLCQVWCVTDFVLLNYDVIIVEKGSFPVLGLLAMTFSSTCTTSPIIIKFYHQVCSMKRSKLIKFQSDVISIDEVMTSQIIRHDVKILRRHISVKNVGIALKLCRLFDLVVAIICTNFCEFSQSRSWFTEIPSFTDVVYLWRHCNLPTAYYKRYGLNHSLFCA